MHTKRPSMRLSGASSSSARVLSKTARLWVLQLTTCRKRSVPGTRAASLMPCAYILPKPNSLPWAMNPRAWGRWAYQSCWCCSPRPLRRTIDDHRRLRQCVLPGIGRVEAEFFELGHFLGLDRQLGSPPDEGEDLHPVVEQRSILVEGELVDL